jgi:antitoxin component YwqK of YwqJK toxin-antitoxin module
MKIKDAQLIYEAYAGKGFTGVKDVYGSKEWYKNGKLHREGDLPAVEWDGSKFWYKNGKLHREGDLPAVEYPDGSKFWFKNGQYHREGDLPAKEYPDGTKEWFKNGQFIKKETPFQVALKDMGLDL